MLAGTRNLDEPAEPDVAQLAGRTSRDGTISMMFVDGRLQIFRTSAGGWCRPKRHWVSWVWHRTTGPGTELEEDGRSFRFRRRAAERVDGVRVRWVATMRGELADDERSVRGTVYSRWTAGPATCEGTVRFTARKTS